MLVALIRVGEDEKVNVGSVLEVDPTDLSRGSDVGNDGGDHTCIWS